jgi:hypothetical protein
VTVVRAAHLLILGVLAGLLIAAGPGVGVFAALMVLMVALGPNGARVIVIIHWPRWVFRALAIPEDARIPTPNMARAWWVQTQEN